MGSGLGLSVFARNLTLLAAVLTVTAGLGVLEPAIRAQRGTPMPPRPPQPDAREIADEYQQLIHRYRSGDVEAAADIAKTWRTASVEAVQDVQRWDRLTLRAAAMLEADAALSRTREVVRKFGLPASIDAATSDAGMHLTLAIRWLDRADKLRPLDKSPFRQQWQVAIGRRLFWDGFVSLADMILGDASLVFPNAPDVWLAYGTVRETAVSYLTALPHTVPPVTGPSELKSDRVRQLDSARYVLGRAVKAPSASAEANVRLAHVRILQRDDDVARTLLEEVRATRPPDDLAYATALLLGGIMERREELQPAASLYQEATRLMPGGQSGYLAHASALRAAGRTREATDALRLMLSRTSGERDPWVRYRLGFDDGVRALQSLRNEVMLEQAAGVAPIPDTARTPVEFGETFHTSPDVADSPGAVTLDVLVTRNDRPVTGLSAADFVVRHNDDRQTVRLVEIEPLPVDVRIAIDTDGGLDHDRTPLVKEAVRGIIARLRPGDRAELLMFAEQIHLAAGLTSDRERLNAAIERLAKSSGASLYDAAFTTLALPARPDAGPCRSSSRPASTRAAGCRQPR